MLSVFDNVDKITVHNVEQNLFLCEVVDLTHEMMLFGLLDPTPLPKHLYDGVMKLGPESLGVARGLLKMLDGQKDDTSGIDFTGVDDVDVQGNSIRFDMRFPETTTVMDLRKRTLSLILSLFGLRASTKIQLLLDKAAQNKAVFMVSDKKTRETSAARETFDSSPRLFESDPVAVHDNPLNEFSTKLIGHPSSSMQAATRPRLPKTLWRRRTKHASTRLEMRRP